MMTKQLIELIELFKTGKASEKEKRMLLDALSLNEQSLKDWLESVYKKEIDEKVTIISKERSDEIFYQIQLSRVKASQEVSQARIIRLSRQWMSWVAVACVLVILVITNFYLSKDNKNKQRLVVAESVKKLKQDVNDTNDSIKITLEDGSDIIIAPKSAISYYKPFGTKRDVSLTGKATFHIAKDARRPFTVFANNIATTALGTVFMVDASNQNIVIKLMEGKVVVRSTNTISTLKDTYLRPGQQVSIDQQTGIYTTKDFRVSNDYSSAKPTKNTNNGKGKRDGSFYALIFKKTPLEKVFNQVGKQYNMLIQYDKQDVNNLSFTGSFLATDSLNTLLTIICNTNDLSFKIDKGIIVITK